MKRFLTSLVIALVISAAASAQGVSCHFGIQGGFVSSGFRGIDVKNLPGWNAGATMLMHMPLFFSLQPSVVYERSRLNVQIPGSEAAENATVALSQNLVTVPVALQWGPDLGILRPFVQAVPYMSVNLKSTPEQGLDVWEAVCSEVRKFQYGFGLGAGLEIWKIQLSFRYNWGIGSWADVKEANLNMFNRKYNSLNVSLAIFFN